MYALNRSSFLTCMEVSKFASVRILLKGVRFLLPLVVMDLWAWFLTLSLEVLISRLGVRSHGPVVQDGLPQWGAWYLFLCTSNHSLLFLFVNREFPSLIRRGLGSIGLVIRFSWIVLSYPSWMVGPHNLANSNFCLQWRWCLALGVSPMELLKHLSTWRIDGDLSSRSLN